MERSRVETVCMQSEKIDQDWRLLKSAIANPDDDAPLHEPRTQRDRLVFLQRRSPRLYASLNEILEKMREAALQGEPTDAVMTAGYQQLIRIGRGDGTLDVALDALAEEAVRLGQVARAGGGRNTPAPANVENVPNQVDLPRPMAVQGPDADERPCDAFPDGDRDVVSIFAHLNDVCASVVPNFGRIALTNPDSAQRAASASVGVGADWFAARQDTAYVNLMESIANGEYKTFDIDCDWKQKSARFLIGFFDKNRDMLPPRVATIINQGGARGGKVKFDGNLMSKAIPESAETVSLSLLCHLSNLIQSGNQKAIAFAFIHAVDASRVQGGVCRRMIDEQGLAAGQRRDDGAGIGGLRDRNQMRPEDELIAEEDNEDIEQGAQGFMGNIRGREGVQGPDDMRYIDIIRRLQVQISEKIDENLNLVQAAHAAMVEKIGGAVGQQRAATWAMLEPMISDTLTDAQTVRTKVINMFSALINAAERGHGLPALHFLMKHLRPRERGIRLDPVHSGNMESAIFVTSDGTPESLQIDKAFVRMRFDDPHPLYPQFQPGGDIHNLTRNRRPAPKDANAYARTAYLHGEFKDKLKQIEGDELFEGDLSANIKQKPLSDQSVQEIINSIDSSQRAKWFAEALYRGSYRRINQPLVPFANLLQQFATGQLNLDQFKDSVTNLQNNWEVQKPAGAMSWSVTMSDFVDKILKEQDRLLAVRYKMEEESTHLKRSGIIDRPQMYALMNYLHAAMDPRKRIHREASVRDEILKIARRLFLA